MREKLIELLKEAEEHATDTCVFNDSCEDCPGRKYGNKCRDYLEADYLIANGVTVQKWIPVTERLPKYNTFVLVFAEGIVGEAVLDDADYWYWAGTDEYASEIRVTHWMPLPEPPKGE